MLNLRDYGFDERGQLIKGWVSKRGRTTFVKDQHGFGHWVAQAMSAGAMFVLFNYLWPAAQTMMQSTVTNMTTLNARMQSSLNGLTVVGTGSTVTITFPSGTTPVATAADYIVTVSGTADTVTNVSVSGQVATITVGTAMNSGSAIVATYTNGSTTYTGSGSAS